MKMFAKKTILAVSAAALISVGAIGSAKADFPERPVEMTILFGGTAKAIGQLLSDLMTKNMAQPVVPVSRTGGGGAVGYTHVHGTDPDGYNIVWNSNSISTSYHKGNMPFDYKAFKGIARISMEVPAIAVNAEKGWKNLDDLKKAAMGGDKLKVGISGKGSFTHLASAALFDAMGIGDKVIYVPYGQGKAPVELLGGRIDAALQWPGQFISHAKAGKLNIIAVTSADRVQAIGDVPTAKEQGFDIDISMWRGLAAPAGTPEPVIKALEAAAKKAVESKEFQEASKKLGFEPAYLGDAAFDKVIAEDDKNISALMDKLGLKN